MGNNPVNGVANGTIGTDASCVVSKDLFYQTQINQINEQNATNMAVANRLANIEAAVATNSAVAACNKDAIRREIEVTNDTFDRTISNERIVNELILKNALCRVPVGDVYLSPNKLADNFVAPTRVLDSYTPREYAPARGFYGGQCGAAFGGYAPGWDGCAPCGGYQGF